MNDSIDRRGFLKLAGGTALVGATGFALAGCGASKGSQAKSSESLVYGAEVNFEEEADVLIMGAGVSGLTAAYFSASAGAKTLVVDKNVSYGGDASNSACTIMCAYADYTAETRPDEAVALEDQLAKMDKRYPDDPDTAEVWKAWYANAASVFDMWVSDWGIKLMDRIVGPYKGIYFPEGGMCQGAEIFATCYKKAQEAGAAFKFEQSADTLILDAEGAVAGMRCWDLANRRWVDYKAKKIILCAGGYASNQEMVAQYYPDWVSLGCVTTQALGEGIAIGQTVGGSLKGMGGYVNLNAHTEHTFVAQMFGRSLSILPNGARFYSETAVHDAATSCLAASSYEWWSIFDDAILNGPHAINVQSGKDEYKVGNTVDELAAAMGMPLSVLQGAFDGYDAICDAGVDEAFGRTLFLEKLQPPYYAYLNRPVRYKSSGGLAVNASGQVLDENGTAIPNLFAAGCTGGTTDVIPAAGSGKVAGEAAAAEL